MSLTLAVRARRAVPADVDALVPAYLAAFADEAVLSWVVPDPTDRAARTASLFRDLLHAAVHDGQVIVAELPGGTLAGMSVWQRPVDATSPPAPATRPTAAALDGLPGRRLATVTDTVAAHRPKEPHLYLASIGVRPDLRGCGAGGVILAEGLRTADADGLPTYLEASTGRSRRLYLRQGFHDHGRPLALPDGGPVLWPMWRPARPGGA
ncbi:GNAT family N-acetyltransferase [Micromonospora globbae]|uniref:GNAT family N-acetyltransferase n=1 Tax=Micromonospora globbae TaxID=1894969 RepID=UPI0037A02509